MSTPTQIFSLFKLLSYPTVGDPHGDHIDEAWFRVPPHRRTIVDCGLHQCESLAAAVSNGFIVGVVYPIS